MTSIGIFGARGRMGQAIAQAAAEAGLDVAGGTNGFEGGTIGAQDARSRPSPPACAEKADILIDFSVPARAQDQSSPPASRQESRCSSGRPGCVAAHHEIIDEAAKSIAVLQTGNTSLGVNLLAALVREAAQRLGDDWDIEIVEMHHRHKVDAPSGTALLLGEAAATGRNITLTDHSASGRDGMTGPRKAGDIGFAALGGGSVAGDHMVILASEGERIELGHRAENRFIFAKGAIKAAQWLIGRAPGRVQHGGRAGS